MANLLGRKEMPYLFLLLVAILGFLIIKAYERASTLKILECSTGREANTARYVFRNLSKNSRVEKAEVFYVDSDSMIKDASIRYIPPAVEPDAPEAPKRVSPTRWHIKIGDLGPSDSVEVTLIYESYKSPPIIRFASSNDILFLYRGLFTFLYANEFYVLLGLIILVLSLSIVYAIFLSRKQAGADK